MATWRILCPEPDRKLWTNPPLLAPFGFLLADDLLSKHRPAGSIRIPCYSGELPIGVDEDVPDTIEFKSITVRAYPVQSSGRAEARGSRIDGFIWTLLDGEAHLMSLGEHRFRTLAEWYRSGWLSGRW